MTRIDETTTARAIAAFGRLLERLARANGRRFVTRRRAGVEAAEKCGPGGPRSGPGPATIL